MSIEFSVRIAYLLECVAVNSSVPQGYLVFHFFTKFSAPGPVGSVLRCTHPNATCIPNRTGFVKGGAETQESLKTKCPIQSCEAMCVSPKRFDFCHEIAYN